MMSNQLGLRVYSLSVQVLGVLLSDATVVAKYGRTPRRDVVGTRSNALCFLVLVESR